MLLQHSIIKFPFNFINAKIQTICTFPFFLILILGLLRKHVFKNGFFPADIFKPNSHALILHYLIKKEHVPPFLNLDSNHKTLSYKWWWATIKAKIHRSSNGDVHQSAFLLPLPPLLIPHSVISDVFPLAPCPPWAVWELHSFISFLQPFKLWVSESMGLQVFPSIHLRDPWAKAIYHPPITLFVNMTLQNLICFYNTQISVPAPNNSH